ncbi:MAG: hypothetical protein ACI35S_09490 [Anaeroplasma sp.]
MSFKALDHSVNIVSYHKENKNYAMCCAWSMMVDYDKIICLLGSQSVTGKMIKKGDIIGFSSLMDNQKNIALALGDDHSDEKDKLNGIDFILDDGAILIKNSKTLIKCMVLDVLHLEGIESDNLLYLKIISSIENDGTFLHMSDFQ